MLKEIHIRCSGLRIIEPKATEKQQTQEDLFAFTLSAENQGIRYPLDYVLDLSRP